MNRVWLLVLAFSLAGITTAHGSSAQDYGAETANLINAERTSRGLAALPTDPRLVVAAQTHNQWMTTNQCFAHQCPGEPSGGERVDAAGYYWYRVGEVIGINYATPAQVVAGWMASSGHQDLLLRADYWSHIGCAYQESAWAIVWTCDLAWDGGAFPSGGGTTPPPPTATALLPPTLTPTATIAKPTATPVPRCSWHPRQGWRCR